MTESPLSGHDIPARELPTVRPGARLARVGSMLGSSPVMEHFKIRAVITAIGGEDGTGETTYRVLIEGEDGSIAEHDTIYQAGDIVKVIYWNPQNLPPLPAD